MCRQRALAGADALVAAGVPGVADALAATGTGGGSADFRCVSAFALVAFGRDCGVVRAGDAGSAFASVALRIAAVASGFGPDEGVDSFAPANGAELFPSSAGGGELLASAAGCAEVAEGFAS